jgi:hypothetical protein
MFHHFSDANEHSGFFGGGFFLVAVPAGVPQNGITNPFAHKVDSLNEWGEGSQSDLRPVMCPLFPAPDFGSGEYARGDIEFCLLTCDLGLSSLVQPIRRHGLLYLVELEK